MRFHISYNQPEKLTLWWLHVYVETARKTMAQHRHCKVNTWTAKHDNSRFLIRFVTELEWFHQPFESVFGNKLCV